MDDIFGTPMPVTEEADRASKEIIRYVENARNIALMDPCD